MPPIFKA